MGAQNKGTLISGLFELNFNLQYRFLILDSAPSSQHPFFVLFLEYPFFFFLSFFFFVVLGLEFRAYTSPFFVKGFFEIGS
jgi:hypothetical protein